jgi:hypothetical protein
MTKIEKSSKAKREMIASNPLCNIIANRTFISQLIRKITLTLSKKDPLCGVMPKKI